MQTGSDKRLESVPNDVVVHAREHTHNRGVIFRADTGLVHRRGEMPGDDGKLRLGNSMPAWASRMLFPL